MNRIVELPADLSPTTDIYLAALITRGDNSDTNSEVHIGKNYSFNGSPTDSFTLVASMRRFAWGGTLTADFLASAAKTAVGNALPTLPPGVPTSSPFPLVDGLAIQLTGPDLILDDVTDFDSLAGTLLVFVGSEIMSIASAALTSAGAYTLMVIRGMFGTSVADHAADDQVFIIRRADLRPFTHPSFQVGNTLSLKTAVGVESVSDAEPLDHIVTGDVGGGLHFISIAPATWAHGGSPTVGVLGSGFLGSGISSMKWDDGGGNTFAGAAGPDDDNHITIDFDYAMPAATYVLYYSTDGGSNWTTTGLSAVVT